MPSINELAIEKTEATPLFSENAQSALYSIAYELYRNGKYEEAKDFFRLLSLTDSSERKYWLGLGACYQMMKKYQEAIEFYSLAAIMNSLDPYAHMHAADCFFLLSNLEKAKEALTSAIMAAKENEIHKALIPELELIFDTWSKQENEETHD